MDSTLIYVCELEPKHLTLEFQERICRKICERDGIDSNIVVVQDDHDKTKLSEIYAHINDYNNVVIFSLACLGDIFDKIYKKIEKIMKSTSSLQCVCCTGVFKGIKKTWPNLTIDQKFILHQCISSSVYEIDLWRELNSM